MYKRGFTLVELIVALAVFGLVVVMALTVLLNVTNSNRTAQTSREALDNIDFVLDDIIREARLGIEYNCGGGSGPLDCSPTGPAAQAFSLKRLDAPGEVVKYERINEAGRWVIKKTVGSSPAQIITSDGVEISLLQFRVTGAKSDDHKHARVFVTLSAAVKDDKVTRSVNFQTTIAQREPDN